MLSNGIIYDSILCQSLAHKYHHTKAGVLLPAKHYSETHNIKMYYILLILF